jgi:hypothetical protein
LERNNFRYRIWVPATEAAGLEGLRFHDLRHAAGTLPARTGATAKEPMARLGHSSSRAAMIYQHAAGERERLIADRLDVMIAEERSFSMAGLRQVALGSTRSRSRSRSQTNLASCTTRRRRPGRRKPHACDLGLCGGRSRHRSDDLALFSYNRPVRSDEV